MAAAVMEDEVDLASATQISVDACGYADAQLRGSNECSSIQSVHAVRDRLV